LKECDRAGLISVLTELIKYKQLNNKADLAKFKATEIVSNNLPESITFWTQANCPFEGNSYEYISPDKFKIDRCEKGERGSHGGCPTCDMSMVSLSVCGRSSYCSLEDYIEGIKNNFEISLVEVISAKESNEFVVPEYPIDFPNKINFKKITNGEYSDGELKDFFHEDVKISTGRLDSKYDGNVAVLSFDGSYYLYLVIVREDGFKKVMGLEKVHKVFQKFKNIAHKVKDKFLFELYIGQSGRNTSSGNTYYCELSNSNFICYETGESGAEESFSSEDIHEWQNNNKSGREELVIKSVAEDDMGYIVRRKEYLERRYYLDEDDNLRLIDWKFLE